MSASSRLLTTAALLAAGVMALGACSSDASSESSAGSSGNSGNAVSTEDSSEGTGNSGSDATVADDDPNLSGVCPDDPRARDHAEVVVNRGVMECGDVTALLDAYTEMVKTGQYGNAGIVPDVNGFSCATPTARSASLQGINIRCSDSTVEILVRPSAPFIPGVQQDVNQFIPAGSLTNGRSFFTLPSGQASCAIYPDHTPPNAACYGPMPVGLPGVAGLAGQSGAPNAVQVNEAGPAILKITGSAPYPIDGVPFTTLNVGQTLASSGFACTVAASDSVTCTNADGNGFRYSPEEVSVY